MKRKCTKFDLAKFISENPESLGHIKNVSVEIHIDNDVIKDILKFFDVNKKKLRIILYHVLQGLPNESLYGREDVSDKAKNIKAMKFKGTLNGRVYCKEFYNEKGKKIVAIMLLEHKNFQKASRNTLSTKLNIIGGYEYEFE